ncbi:MAG TPA: family 16 glycoside hydrolase [Verrucomicrobiae bacterium]|nr:family 16 glycoside hydrolase [Verrucomicrobiae bacterium]
MRIFIFWICLAFVTSGFGAELKIDFGDYSAGQTPTNFHPAMAGGGKPGDWKIVMDEVASAFAPLTPQAAQAATPHKQPVLAQTNVDPTDERFPMFVYDGETFRDFKLTTQFKIINGVMEQMAGVVFRFQNESNFYVVRASALGRNLRFYKVVDGIRSDPIGPALDISTGAWHSLAIQCQGNQITCWLDDKLAMPSLNDNTFSAGKIGFWTKSDSLTYFGDTTINYTPRVPMAQSLVDNAMKKYPRILGLRIYALDDKGEPRVIASKSESELGQPGADSEKSAITKNQTLFGRGDGKISLVLPLCDRNGDPIAAVWVQLKSFIGETQNTAITRGKMVVRYMQSQVGSAAELNR